MNSHVQAATSNPGQPARVAVARHGGSFRVTASEAIEEGQVILGFHGVVVGEPTRTTLQLDGEKHLDVPAGLELEQLLDDYPWRFLNHSCAANGALKGRALVALRPIRAGEPVTFNYNTTEYDMSTPFDCGCGAQGCAGKPVRGFKHLSRAEQQSLRPYLAAHLRRSLEGAEAKKH